MIYRLGFLSDLEHPVWNQQDSKDLAAVLGMITALCMTVVMMRPGGWNRLILALGVLYIAGSGMARYGRDNH